MAAVFLEQRLSARITQGAQGGPMVPGRTKTYLPGGKLVQSFNATMAVHRYDVSHGVRSHDDFQAVLDVFYVVLLTPYTGFRFKDWRDYKATRTNSKLTLVSGTTWQLQRKHTFGGVEFLRDIQKPLAGAVIYDAGGSILTGTTDTTNGLWTGTGTPAAWVGEFDVPVTFTDDEWTSDIETMADDGAWVSSAPIKLEEIRL